MCFHSESLMLVWASLVLWLNHQETLTQPSEELPAPQTSFFQYTTSLICNPRAREIEVAEGFVQELADPGATKQDSQGSRFEDRGQHSTEDIPMEESMKCQSLTCPATGGGILWCWWGDQGKPHGVTTHCSPSSRAARLRLLFPASSWQWLLLCAGNCGKGKKWEQERLPRTIIHAWAPAFFLFGLVFWPYWGPWPFSLYGCTRVFTLSSEIHQPLSSSHSSPWAIARKSQMFICYLFRNHRILLKQD